MSRALVRLAISASAVVCTLYALLLVGILTGAAGMCATASDGWVRAFLVLVFALPLGAGWAAWHLLGTELGGFGPVPARTDEVPGV